MWGLQSTAVHVYSQRSDLVPLHPTSLTHKNPQRRKLIYGTCPAGHKQQSINLFEDFLSPPTWLGSAGYSARHFFTGGVF